MTHKLWATSYGETVCLWVVNFDLGSGAPTNEYDDGDSDNDSNVSDDSDQEDIDPLETFLSVLNLTEYYPLFKKERMDLDGNLTNLTFFNNIIF